MAKWDLELWGEAIGWVPVDAEGQPYRTTRGQGSVKRVEPIKVYRVKWRAEAMSPVGIVKEVRMFE